MDTSASRPIDPAVRIGHVHLKVADLERALTFYCGVLGFEVTQRWGSQAAFLSAGGYHHHIALNTWESRGGPEPAPGSTGLYHLAILYPSRRELADALRDVLRAGITLDGAADHGVSEALYLRDPDQNGVELYWDRPKEHWPYDATGQLGMYSHPLDLQSLLGESPGRDMERTERFREPDLPTCRGLPPKVPEIQKARSSRDSHDEGNR